MKKLLFIHVKLVCGGAENALFNLLNLLDKTKYDISVLVLQDGGEWEQKFRDAGIRVIHLFDGQIPGRYLRNFFLRKRINGARGRYGKGLIPLVIKEKYDLIVEYHNLAAYKAVCAGIPERRIKYIHGDVGTNQTLRGLIAATREHLPEFQRVICVSQEARRSFDAMTGLGDRSCVCYNPIDSSRILERSGENPGDIPEGKYICAVGRLSAEKGFARLIRIHKNLCNQGLEHRLVIVGDGPEKAALEALVEELDCGDSVVLTGYRSNPYPYMKNSFFTVCSSFTEGLPVIAMEAMCLGIPMVSSYPSVGELFGDECCGIITKCDNKSLEAGIRKMLTDADFYKQAKLGAEKRSGAFSSRVMVRQVEEIYDSVMEEK